MKCQTNSCRLTLSMFTIILLLAIGACEAVHHHSSNNIHALINSTRHLSFSHNSVKHFTFYRHKASQKVVTDANPIGVQRRLPCVTHTNDASTDLLCQHIPHGNDHCSIKVHETNLSHNCGCTKQGTESPLDDALNCVTVQRNNLSSIEIELLSANLTLTNTYTFRNISSINFTGKPTTIQCSRSGESGIKFLRSQNIVFKDVLLLDCGFKYNSTSTDFTHPEPSAHVVSLTAVYLLCCYNIAFTRVHIVDSNGTGLTMVNCRGDIDIEGSKFVNNTVKGSKDTPGGGGLSIETKEYCTNPHHFHSNSTTNYHITNCNFSGNFATSGKFLITHITSYNTIYFTFGQGGGMAVNFGHSPDAINITLSHSIFTSNVAQRGGGLFVAFRNNSIGNYIVIDNTTFQGNNCTQQKLPPGSSFSSGGGIKAVYHTNAGSNSWFNISGSRFICNIAFFGGAISLASGADYYNFNNSKQPLHLFSIDKCEFNENNARIGAALDLYYRVSAKHTQHKSVIFPLISDSNFTDNGGLYYYITDNATGRTFATIYIEYIPTMFEGTIHIANNTASGFGIEEATVWFATNALINLTNNTAKIGGGIALIGKSTVVLYENTTVLFLSNLATEKGGAIFSSQSQERYAAYQFTCFIQFYSYNSSPSKWTAKLIFDNNTVNAGSCERNDIFASSLLPCVWPSSPSSKLQDDITQTFCDWGDSWNFSTSGVNNCSELIKTAPSKFKNPRYSVVVIPGNITKIPNFGVLDDLGHDASASALYTASKITDQSKTELLHNLEITVTNSGIQVKTPNKYMGKNLTIYLQTADRKSITTEINVRVLHCPPGYTLDTGKNICECNMRYNFGGEVVCDQNPYYESTIFAGHCITHSVVKKYNKSKTIVARCPHVVGSLKGLYVSVPYNISVSGMEDAFCWNFSRTGKLCKDCAKNFCLDVYSINFRCIMNNKSTSRQLNWIKVVAASTIPTTLLFILCTVFHISITSARINGFIFFSHVVTMRLDVLTMQYAWNNLGHDGECMTNVLYTPYRLWTFDFPQILLKNICLGDKFKVLYALALPYLSALYPLLLVFTAIILIELHAKNCKPLVWLWKPLCYLCVRFRHSWHIRTSVIDTFASFLLLSYSNLIGVSMSLLTQNSIVIDNGTVIQRALNYDTSVVFFEGIHLKFGAFAVVILCTFGAVPPLLLIFYPFKRFQVLLNRCNLKGCRFLQVFVDAFQGSYKNNVKGYPERRYFAGVYFLFRIAINVIYVAVEDLIKLHLTLTLTYVLFLFIIMAQRPYKRNFYNILDGFFMAILVTSHALTLYLVYYAATMKTILKPVFYFNYSIQNIPTLYMILLVIYSICFRMRCIKRFCLSHFGRKALFFKNEVSKERNSLKSPLENYDWPSSSSLVLPSPSTPSSPYAQSEHLSDIPDRVENPQRYEPMIDSWQFSDKRIAHEISEYERLLKH